MTTKRDSVLRVIRQLSASDHPAARVVLSGFYWTISPATRQSLAEGLRYARRNLRDMAAGESR